jgi:hypothetical protein
LRNDMSKDLTLKKRGKDIFSSIDFDVRDDHILTGKGTAAREVYFLRFFPRNMSILSLEERISQHKKLQAVLDSAEVLPSFFILDKTEGLTANKTYFESLLAKYPQYAQIHNEVLQNLAGITQTEDSVERAFYFVLRCRDRGQYERFLSLADDWLNVRTADREELLVILRNFMLREYTPFKLLEFDRDVELLYNTECHKQSEKRRPKYPEMDALRQQETQKLLLPTQIRFGTRYAAQSGFFRKTVAIRNYPASFERDGILRELGTMPGVSMHIYLDPVSAASSDRLMRKQLQAKRSDALSAQNAGDSIEAGNELERLKQSYRKMLDDHERMSFVTVFIEVYGETEQALLDKLARVNSTLLAYGITKDDLLFEQQNGYLSMLPFGSNHLELYSRNLPHSTVTAMYPFDASRKVDAEGIPLGKTISGSPAFIDFFLRSQEITNGNVLIAGGSGQGKSYTVKKFLMFQMAAGTATYTIDPENEYIPLYRHMGGTVADCGTGKIRINPFEIRAFAVDEDDLEEGDPAAFRVGSAWRQHLSWLRDFFPVVFPDLRGDLSLLNALMILTQACYEACSINDGWDITKAKPEQYPTFGSLYDYIQTVHDNWENFSEKFKMLEQNTLRRLMLCLYDAVHGAAAPMLNGITNVPDVRHINFAVQSLMEGAKNIRDAVLFNITTWIWNRVLIYQERLALTLDELYLMIDRDNPTMAIYLRNIEKRNRKFNAVLVIATQDLVDLRDPEIEHLTSPLLSLPAHKFLFWPGAVDMADMARLLHLTPSELDVIRESRQRHCLYIGGNEKYHLVIGTLDCERDLFYA